MSPDEPPPSSVLADVVARVVERFEADQVPWFQKLVDAPSHTYARTDVEDAARLVDVAMAKLGVEPDRHPSDGRFADHRVYTLPAVEPHTPAMALVGHVDTVFPRSMGFLQWGRDPENRDVVRGPGTLDMKSGLSVIVFALWAIWDVAPDVWMCLACMTWGH